jgi:hypothetical protein
VKVSPKFLGKEKDMRKLFIVTAGVFTLLAVWVARSYGMQYALIPVIFTLLAVIFAYTQKPGKMRAYKPIFIALSFIFVVIAIYQGLESPEAKLVANIALPAACALIFLVASCFEEIDSFELGMLSLIIFAIAGSFDRTAWWLLVVLLPFVMYRAYKENEKLNTGE